MESKTNQREEDRFSVFCVCRFQFYSFSKRLSTIVSCNAFQSYGYVECRARAIPLFRVPQPNKRETHITINVSGTCYVFQRTNDTEKKKNNKTESSVSTKTRQTNRKKVEKKFIYIKIWDSAFVLKDLYWLLHGSARLLRIRIRG